MKTLIILSTLTLALTSGCTTYNYSKSYANSHPAKLRESQYTLINNCGYRLNLYQDGKEIGTAEVGQVVPIRGGLLWSRTVVSVTGYDTDGYYVGTASWIYEYGMPQIWTINSLSHPAHP